MKNKDPLKKIIKPIIGDESKFMTIAHIPESSIIRKATNST